MSPSERAATRDHPPSPSSSQQSKFDLTKVSAHVDRVNVNGLLRTHDDYVKRVADELFKAKNFQDVMLESMNARSYLQELGVFKDVAIRIDVSKGDHATTTDDGYEVTFKGTELSRIVGKVGTEVGQNEGSLRTEVTFPNLFGRGESLSLNGSYSSSKANDVSLKFWKSFFHTRFVNCRPELSFSLFRRIDRMDISSFQVSNLGILADFSVSSLLPFELRHSFQYETAFRELSLLAKNVPFVIREHCGPTMASLLRYSVMFDNRDNTIFPMRGFMVKTTNEYSGGFGGNVAYVSTNTLAEVNAPLFGGLVAQATARVGVIKATKRTSRLPIGNLFYCGGPMNLRGFRYGGAGPSIDGTPIGAQTYWATGLHLWGPLPFSRVFKGLADNFRTHLFYNVGNFNTFSLENMRSAAGVGLAFKLANQARIELNYCVPIKKFNTDKAVSGFQFGIGYEFV